MDDDVRQRRRMVDEQIAARGIRDARVLAVMADVPRHLFTPSSARGAAYEDRPLPIGEGQTISQPYMVALMTATLSPRDGDRVLEIGTGSGYQTAILARLAAQVVSIERHAALAAQAQARIHAAGITNVQIVVGDGSAGTPQPAQFERILVTAGAPSVPESLRSQLADGGRLVIPVGPLDMQRLVIVDRHGHEFDVREGEACVFVPLIGREGWEGS